MCDYAKRPGWIEPRIQRTDSKIDRSPGPEAFEIDIPLIRTYVDYPKVILTAVNYFAEAQDRAKLLQNWRVHLLPPPAAVRPRQAYLNRGVAMPRIIPVCPNEIPPTSSHAQMTRTYSIRLITPMFGGGVEPGVPDESQPIRGKLRF